MAADRLSVHWYLGFNLDEALPDHSSLLVFATRYGLEVFRRFFAAIVEQCQQAELVWGKELYFDATQVKADTAMDGFPAALSASAGKATSVVILSETLAAHSCAHPRGQRLLANVLSTLGFGFEAYPRCGVAQNNIVPSVIVDRPIYSQLLQIYVFPQLTCLYRLD